MEKALEILEHFKEVEIINEDTKFPVEYYDEAIAELEELQQPKSCDDCRSKSCSVKRILLELGEINSSYFYCNDYEPKE